MEQMQMNLTSQDEIVPIEKLRRKKEPLISKVIVDDYIKEVSKNFDYEFKGQNVFYPFELPRILKDLDYNILAIVGASGSGKSVLGRELEKLYDTKIINDLKWDNNKSIISNFECDTDEAIKRLSAVGFNSIPNWCKPRNVLSIGEGFRVDLARSINDSCIIDEFTSTIDRNVAKSCSTSIQKFIRKKNYKKCTFISCHKDFIDYLMPDYVIDIDEGYLYDTRRKSRKSIKLSIYNITSKKRVWNIFAKYHYLSRDINIASKCFACFYENEIVGFIAILPLPSGTVDNAWRVHRLVVLPEYQGLGVGGALLSYFANLVVKEDCKLYIRTSHPKMRNMLSRNMNWIQTARSGTVSPANKNLKSWKSDGRVAYSFKYNAPYKNNYHDDNIHIIKHKYNKKIKKYSIFDF